MTLQGFFRRCITQGMTHKCANEEKCEITPFTRNSCQYCRLKKCFEVGMSREGKKYFVFLCCYGLSCLLSELVTYGVGLMSDLWLVYTCYISSRLPGCLLFDHTRTPGLTDFLVFNIWLVLCNITTMNCTGIFDILQSLLRSLFLVKFPLFEVFHPLQRSFLHLKDSLVSHLACCGH